MIAKDDPRLTAYALGELDTDAVAEVEAALSDDAEAQAEVVALRALAVEVREAFAGEAETTLTPAQREAIRDQARRGPEPLTAPAWHRWQRPLGLAASLLVVLSVLALMRWGQPPETIMAQSVRQPEALDADRLEILDRTAPHNGGAKVATAAEAPIEDDNEVASADAGRVATDANASTSREGLGGTPTRSRAIGAGGRVATDANASTSREGLGGTDEGAAAAAENAGAVATRAETSSDERVAMAVTAAAPQPSAPRPMPKPAAVDRPDSLAELAVREDVGLAGRRAGTMAAPGGMAAPAVVAGEAVAAARSRRSVPLAMDLDAAPQRLDARPAPERAAILSKATTATSPGALDKIRESILQGRLPAPASVRVEAIVNAFRYDDPPPQGEAALAVHAEVATCPWNPRHRLLRLAVRAQEAAPVLHTARMARPAIDARSGLAAGAVSLTVEALPERLEAWRRIGADAPAPMETQRHQRLDLGDLVHGASRVVLIELVPVAADGDLTTAMAARREQTRRLVEAGDGAPWLTLTLQWSTPGDAGVHLAVIPVPDVVRPWPGASADLRFASAVARFAALLRQGMTPAWADDTQAVIEMASGALGTPPAAERLEFMDLVRDAQRLQAARPATAP